MPTPGVRTGTPPSGEPLRDAIAHHQAGRVVEAEAIYRRILADEPSRADALHLLGLAAYQLGRGDEAIASIGRAIALQPAIADYHNNLGAAFRQAGRLAEAEASYRTALRLKPDFPEAYSNLGNILVRLGRLDDAVSCYRAALRLRPDDRAVHASLGDALASGGRAGEAEAAYRAMLRIERDDPETQTKLANVLRTLGRLAEAAECCRTVLGLRPDQPEAHRNLGLVLLDLGDLADAEACCRAALRRQPGYAQGHTALGNVLQRLGRLEEAASCHREALRLAPDDGEAQLNLGTALRDLGRFEDAEAHLRDIVARQPGCVPAHNNLGVVLTDLGRPAEAEACYRAALALDRTYPQAHKNLGHALLLAGRFEEAWPEHEWRWQLNSLATCAPRGFAQPQWLGEALGERTLLLHAEQGIGDTLQFCRYVPLAAARGRVVLEVPRSLVRLAASLAGAAQIVAKGDALPAFDLHCPLLSLPYAFGTTLDTVPRQVPYLAAEPLLASAWRKRLGHVEGIRIGLVWAGNPTLPADRRRSLALERLAPLAEVPGVSFVSLQKGEPAAQVRAAAPRMLLHDWTDEIGDFADTAALIEGLDLVISVDSAVAHLAGALGKPVWLLNRFDTCWRWMLGRDDSPWYPTLRQFRQPRPGDWDSVIGRVRAALTDLRSAHPMSQRAA